MTISMSTKSMRNKYHVLMRRSNLFADVFIPLLISYEL